MSVAQRNWKSVFVGLLEAALVLTIVFSVATAFDQWHRFLELFSHFRLQYFAVSLLLTIAFAFMKWRGYILLGLAAIAFNAYFIVPWYLPVADQEPAETDIKLLHSNLMASNDDASRFIDLVQNEQPDLLVMQEFTPGWQRELSVLESSYPYRVAEPRDDSFGIALFSKFPLDATTVIASVPLGYPDIVATALVAGKRLTIISTHPIPPIGSNNYGSRNLQLDAAATLASRTPSPKIVVGDLNISMWAHHYEKFEERSGLTNSRRGFGIEPTWPLFMPLGIIPIDHCLISSDMVVTGFTTGPNIGSDHLPIIVTMSIRP